MRIQFSSKFRNAFKALAVGAVLWLSTMWLTYSSGWLVTFDASDAVVVDTGISNALTNMWAGFLFILPYLGVALWVMIVIGVIMFIAKRARS